MHLLDSLLTFNARLLSDTVESASSGSLEPNTDTKLARDPPHSYHSWLLPGLLPDMRFISSAVQTEGNTPA